MAARVFSQPSAVRARSESEPLESSAMPWRIRSTVIMEPL